MYIVLKRSFGFPVLANILLPLSFDSFTWPAFPLTSHFPYFPTNQRHNSTTYAMVVQKQKDLYIYIYIPHVIAKLPTFVLLHSGFSLSLSLKLEFVEVLCFLTETPWRLEFRLLQARQRTVSNKKTYQIPTPISNSISYSQKICGISSTFRKIKTLGVCLVMEKKTEDVIQVDEEIKSADCIKNQITGASRATERSCQFFTRKRFERCTYIVAAIMSIFYKQQKNYWIMTHLIKENNEKDIFSHQ
jgi:hypothetical protein